MSTISKRKNRKVKFTMEKIMVPLKDQIMASLTELVRLVARNLCVEQIDTLSIVVMIKAIKMALTLIPVEGLLGHLQTLVVCRYAEKGIEVPKEIEDLLTPIAPSQEVMKSIALPLQDALLVDRMAPPTPIDQVPARKLAGPDVKEKSTTKVVKTPEMQRDALMGILYKFLSGEEWIDAERTRGFIASVFNSGVELKDEHWQIMLESVRISWGRNMYLLDRSISSEFFDSAPPHLLRQTVFGDDGLIVTTIAQLSEVCNLIPPALIAKTHVVVDAVDAIDRGKDPGLRDNEIDRLKNLESAVRTAQGPGNLLDKIEEILSYQKNSTESVVVGKENAHKTAMELAFQKAVKKTAATV